MAGCTELLAPMGTGAQTLLPFRSGTGTDDTDCSKLTSAAQALQSTQVKQSKQVRWHVL
jgi:hypothetical protein